MMAPRRVVIVLQAEALLVPKRESEAATRALDAARGAASSSPSRRRRSCWSPAPLDKRSRMYKLLQKHATIVECGALEDQADAERWVRTRVARGRRRDRAGRRRGCSPSAPAPT